MVKGGTSNLDALSFQVEPGCVDTVEDEELLKRLTVVLCDGLFSYADDETATQIMVECLSLCSDSREALSRILQMKFIGTHTPFYWVIANMPAEQVALKKLPPLLSRFMDLCGEDFPKETQEEILEGLFYASNDSMYQIIKSRLPAFYSSTEPPSLLVNKSDPPTMLVQTTSDKDFILHFTFPRFYDRILVDKEISHYFLAIGSLWCFKAVTTNPLSSDVSAWVFELTETYTKRLVAQDPYYYRTIEVNIKESAAINPRRPKDLTRKAIDKRVTVPRYMIVDVGPNPPAQLHSNTYISKNNRALVGSLIVNDKLDFD